MDIEFQKRLLAIFRDETKEHLAAISDGLLALEKAVEPEIRKKVLDSVFREAHSLKGAARSVGMSGIESLSHALEGVFAGIKRQEVASTPVLFDLLHRAADGIAGMILADETGRDAAGEPSLTELIARLNQAAKNAPPPPPETAAPREVQENRPGRKKRRVRYGKDIGGKTGLFAAPGGRDAHGKAGRPAARPGTEGD